MATKKTQAPTEPTGDAPEPETPTDTAPGTEAQEGTSVALLEDTTAAEPVADDAAVPDWTVEELDRAREIMAAAGFDDPDLPIPVDLLLTVRAGVVPEDAVTAIESDPIPEETHGTRPVHFRWRSELGITRPGDPMQDVTADVIVKMGDHERQTYVDSPFYETTWAE